MFSWDRDLRSFAPISGAGKKKRGTALDEKRYKTCISPSLNHAHLVSMAKPLTPVESYHLCIIYF